MRIQTAISQMAKIDKYIQECADSDTNFYESTRDGLITLMSYINSIHDNIQHILSGKPSENTSSSESLTSDIAAKLDTIINRMNMVEDRISKLESETSEESTSFEASKAQSVSIWSAQSNTLDASASKTETSEADDTISSKKKIMNTYAIVLERMANTDHGSENINDVCCILWDWFKIRFLENSQYKSGFHYNPEQFPTMIYSIVMDFGHHIEHNTTHRFKNQFNSWMDKIGIDEAITNRGSTPSECYKIGKDLDSYYGNPTSLVIYTVLWELGLKNLVDMYPDGYKAFPSECGIDRLLKNLGKYPEDAEQYHHLKNPDILYNLKILSCGEVLK